MLRTFKGIAILLLLPGGLIVAAVLVLWLLVFDKGRKAVRVAKAQLGKPYLWGGRTPDRGGFDCSGLVTFALASAGLAPWSWNQTHTAARLYEETTPTDNPKPGDLAFYKVSGKIVHVMLYIGRGKVLGASGGDSTTTTPEEAKRRGAQVQIHPFDYWKTAFTGYGTLRR